MLQRVMIGLAVKLEPDLIVCDEPTTAIDSISRYAVMQEFLRIKKSTGAAMIFNVNFQRFPTLEARRFVNAPKMSAHHRGIYHF